MSKVTFIIGFFTFNDLFPPGKGKISKETARIVAVNFFEEKGKQPAFDEELEISETGSPLLYIFNMKRRKGLCQWLLQTIAFGRY